MTNLDSLPTPGRIADLMIFVIPIPHRQQTKPSQNHPPILSGVAHLPINQILHNTPTLKHPNLLAIRKLIRESRDSPIGIDFLEPRLLLRVLRELDAGGFVWEAANEG